MLLIAFPPDRTPRKFRAFGRLRMLREFQRYPKKRRGGLGRPGGRFPTPHCRKSQFPGSEARGARNPSNSDPLCGAGSGAAELLEIRWNSGNPKNLLQRAPPAGRQPEAPRPNMASSGPAAPPPRHFLPDGVIRRNLSRAIQQKRGELGGSGWPATSCQTALGALPYVGFYSKRRSAGGCGPALAGRRLQGQMELARPRS